MSLFLGQSLQYIGIHLILFAMPKKIYMNP
ncbi:hypothetical protein J2W80_006130 [Methylorubrum extorquens]|nr:hypothetical protein [Methylorubrum extorquens]MCP1590905.1 hypothetical protein [Methylorubrum extorquens]